MKNENIKPQSKIVNFLVVAGLTCSLISLSSLFSSHYLIFDLISHFRMQYIFLILGVIFLALYFRKYLISIVLICCMLTHVVAVVNSLSTPNSENITKGLTVRVMSSNLLASNTRYKNHIDYIKDVDPDVIIFQEYTSAWARALSTSLVEYKYKISEPLENPFGIALYSKLPFTKLNTTILENKRRPSVDGII